MSYETAFDEIYGGAYFTAKDVAEGPIRYVVESLEDKADIRDASGKGMKRALVVHFIGTNKLLILNKTNAKILGGELGTKGDWVGAVLELFETDTNTGKGVRVRVIKKPANRSGGIAISMAPTPQPRGELNDDVPF